MADEDKGHKPDSEIEKPRPPRVRSIWGVGYIKRKVKERNAKYKDETPTDKAARITASATKWMAVFTFILVLCTGATVVILKLQLKEMHDDGKDTHDLAEAAKKQADAAKSLADATKIQSDNTVTLAQAASDQVDRLQRLVNAAIIQGQAAKQANDILQASQLPWMGIVDATSLVLEPQQHPDASVNPIRVTVSASVDFTIKNYGTSPALGETETTVFEPLTGPVSEHRPIRESCGFETYKNAPEANQRGDFILPGGTKPVHNIQMTTGFTGPQSNAVTADICVFYRDQTTARHYSGYRYVSVSQLVVNPLFTGFPATPTNKPMRLYRAVFVSATAE